MSVSQNHRVNTVLHNLVLRPPTGVLLAKDLLEPVLFEKLIVKSTIVASKYYTSCWNQFRLLKQRATLDCVSDKQKKMISSSSGAGKCKIRVPSRSGFGEGLLPGYRRQRFSCVRTWQN